MRVDAKTKEVTLTEDEYKKLTDAPKIKGWVARDKNGSITLYENKPYRDGDIWRGCSWKPSMIYEHFFPNLKWEDECIEVELIIRKNDINSLYK